MGAAGDPKTGGRKPGSLNKKTAKVYEILQKRNFSVIDELIDLYHASKDDPDTVGTAATCLKEIAHYVYPKLAATQITGQDGGPIEIRNECDELTDEELEAKVKAILNGSAPV